VGAAQPWHVPDAFDLPITEPPSEHELRLIREELDPQAIYTARIGPPPSSQANGRPT
jgi:hypothetical protein